MCFTTTKKKKEIEMIWFCDKTFMYIDCVIIVVLSIEGA